MPSGRPSLYTPEIAQAICQALAEGHTLRQVCKRDGMPDATTIVRWALEDREGFYKLYARAREIRAEHMCDELCDIADEGANDWYDREGVPAPDHEHIQRSRLRVDTRKWLMSKFLPKMYGDKLEHTGAGGGAIELRVITGVDRGEADTGSADTKQITQGNQSPIVIDLKPTHTDTPTEC